MWWFVAVGAVVAFLVFCALYAEFGPGVGKKGRDSKGDTNANYGVITAISNGRRNQTSGM
ncbi:hypothetical protein F0U44_11520 [Nocardioides humilatus]|uniref:Uncharacterized protein n=1 Tax=Nocardioides humilatus TaxID=2607660 RepID=A0A5B1LEE8_9ACTN|nr:hypothetical protein [Nocardioides humilatus]KAA1419083.1 hypothetical protein F0U44_11520 [Nocardioides humilatus]